jgi:hypothetical protein
MALAPRPADHAYMHVRVTDPLWPAAAAMWRREHGGMDPPIDRSGGWRFRREGLAL